MAKDKVEEEYEEKDLRTHIYETTDTYAGSDQMIKGTLAIMKEGEKKITLSETEYIPVIYKMFDEIIVNARDQRERLKDRKGSVQLTEIKVTIDNNILKVSASQERKEYSRSLLMPEESTPAGSSVSYEDGLLTIKINKKESAKTIELKIK